MTIRPVAILWYDPDPARTLDQKVAAARAHYERKYGRAPEVCMVNPSMMPAPVPDAQPYSAAGLRVQPKRYVMPNHIYIGALEDTRP